MHTWHESTGLRLSCNKILIINSNDNTQSGQSENGLTFKCDFLESLCSLCKDVCDGSKFSRRHYHASLLCDGTIIQVLWRDTECLVNCGSPVNDVCVCVCVCVGGGGGSEHKREQFNVTVNVNYRVFCNKTVLLFYHFTCFKYCGAEIKVVQCQF